MRNAHGRFMWHDLATTNGDAAQAFYPVVTSWGTQTWEQSPAYVMWTNDGAPLGGIVPLDDVAKSRGTPPHWLSYVGVYDVDESVRKVEALGGQVRMPPKEVTGVGSWAVIADPQGATIGLYEPDTAPTAQAGPPKRGEFSWHELMTTNYNAASEFYRAVLQWETLSEFDMGPMGVYHLFGQKGQTYGGMFTKPDHVPRPNWLHYIRVDDVNAAAEKVAANGGAVILAPTEVPGGDRIAQCTDPQGTMFALHTPKS